MVSERVQEDFRCVSRLVGVRVSAVSEQSRRMSGDLSGVVSEVGSFRRLEGVREVASGRWQCVERGNWNKRGELCKK